MADTLTLAPTPPTPPTAPVTVGKLRTPGRLRRLLSGRTLLLGGCVVLVTYLAVVPLYFLLHDTFTGPQGFTLGAFSRAYGAGSGAGSMLVNSVIYSAGAAALALALGTALAWIQVRTDAPFKRLIFVASLGPLIIPSILYTTSWIFLADKDIGVVNVDVMRPIFGGTPFDIFSLPGMVWVQGLHHAPIAFLLMVAGFRAMDPSLEESAATSGARRATVLRRVTLPLLRPALAAAVLLVFVQSLESFEVPALLGLQNGTYVFTSRIYFELRSFPIDYGAAGAYAIVLLGVAATGILLNAWMSRSGSNFQTISGKAFRPRPVELRRARPWVGAGVVLYFIVAVALPLIVLVYSSLLPFYSKPSVAAFRTFSMRNYRELFQLPEISTALRNTLILGLAAATIVVIITSVCSWIVARTRIPGRRVLDLLAFTPLVIPGLVLGLALSFLYLRVSLPIYGTLWIILISYVTRYLPYGMRYTSSAMMQVGTELEESATVCGASWWNTFRRILLPLTSSGLVAGWIYIFIVSVRELSSTILLYTPGNEVLSVTMFEQYQDGKLTQLAALGVLLVAGVIILVAIASRLGAKFGLSKELE